MFSKVKFNFVYTQDKFIISFKNTNNIYNLVILNIIEQQVVLTKNIMKKVEKNDLSGQ